MAGDIGLSSGKLRKNDFAETCAYFNATVFSNLILR